MLCFPVNGLPDGYRDHVPRAVDHDQRRTEIITAAWDVLASEGLEGATMRHIAQAASCTTGLLTHYFDGRDDILVAALRTVHDTAAQRMSDVVAVKDGLDALRSVLLEALPLDRARYREWLVWLAFWGRAGVDPDLRRENRERYRQWRRAIEGLLDASVSMGELPEVDVRLETDHLIVLIDGLGMQTTLDPTPARRRAARELVDAHLASLARRRPEPI